MTDTIPTPITDAAVVHREYILREMDIYSHKFVLADFARTLERELAAIKSQPVPVEADVVKLLSEQDYEYNRKTNALIKRHAKQIDSLQSALQVAQQELEVQMVGWSDCEEKLTKAEERNKRLVELLKALLGALKHPVPPTQKQWDAIGVVSDNILLEMGK